MMPADLKRLQKYMLEVEGTDPILDDSSAGARNRSGTGFCFTAPHRALDGRD
jgi:hypothetical protein